MKKWIPFLELASLHESIADELMEKFKEVLKVGIFSAGRDVALLENNIRDMLKLPSAIPCSNGTDALELALKALEIGQGDEVIVPALSWISTAEAVANVGAKPVFCDVDANGLIAVKDAEKKVSKHTKAVIPVHLYGKMVEMKGLLDFAEQRKLRVIEDAAQAFGAFQEGRSAGSFGDIGCFSFYPTKNLGALGEAGLLTTSEVKLEERLRWILNHGQSDRQVHELVGGNSKIDTLQAGFLNIKLRHFGRWQLVRKDLASVYLKNLQGIKGLYLPESLLKEDHNAHLFTIRWEKRDALKAYLETQGIGTAIHFPIPLPKTPAFFSLSSFPVAEEISRTTLSLPLHPFLKEENVVFICRMIGDYFSERFHKDLPQN